MVTWVAKGSSSDDCGLRANDISTAVYAELGLACKKASTRSSPVGCLWFNLSNSSLEIGNLSLRLGDSCSLRVLSALQGFCGSVALSSAVVSYSCRDLADV